MQNKSACKIEVFHEEIDNESRSIAIKERGFPLKKLLKIQERKGAINENELQRRNR